MAAGPIVDGGEITKAMTTFWDANDRLRAESDLSLFAAIIDSTGDAVLSVDLSNRITSWNRGAQLLFGYESEEVLGRPVSILFPPDEDPAGSLPRIIGGESVPYVEKPWIRKDGSTVTVGLTISPVRGIDGAVVGGAAIARNVMERLAGAQVLADTRRELEAKNRRLERSNAELEQFAYVASHDLSEPLRAVSGMVGLLGRRYKGRLDDDADEFIGFAVDGCERMRAMIHDLLVYSRGGRVELGTESVDTADVLDSVLAMLSVQIGETDADVEVGEMPMVEGDRSQLIQVFQNLIANAIKFRRPHISPRIVVSARLVGGREWRFEVADNGIGIEASYRERIFRMFQRLHTREAYPGSGIGLSIAERIVDRHGGRMGVDENPAGGCSFWFTIPVQVPQP